MSGGGDKLNIEEDDAFRQNKIKSSGGNGASPAAREKRPRGIIQQLDLAREVERVHRRYLDLLRAEMAKLGINDVSPAQVLMLFTIGNDELSVRDLLERGNYLGSNASYNLKRLWEADYIVREASARDRRSARIHLTERGHTLCETIRNFDRSHQALLTRNDEEYKDLETTIRTLRRIEMIFVSAIRYGDIAPGDG